MRYAIISDIHSNLTALEAVFDDLRSRGPFDGVRCTGDVVGYGPDPNECIDFLRGFDLRCVVGNHDLASIGRLNLETFNPEARAACEWTISQLTNDSRQYLASLPQIESEGDYTLVHGSPRSPIWEYIVSPSQAKASFRSCPTRHCFVGHTHVPALYVYVPESNSCIGRAMPTEQGLEIDQLQGRLLVNPGSVGQPRDLDPRASYVILDTDTSTLFHYRVHYDIDAVQQRMRRHGLPRRLIERLSYGW